MKSGQRIMQPQEVEVFYIIPAIRSRMAAMLKGQGMSQKDIAALLCVQESTISQYISSKRAADVKFPERIDKEINKAVKRIKTQGDLITEMQRILEMAKNEKVICKVHKAFANLPEGCDVCYFRR